MTGGQRGGGSELTFGAVKHLSASEKLNSGSIFLEVGPDLGRIRAEMSLKYKKK